MNDLFTVVSLVLAVSGATYAALVALRASWQSQLDSLRAESAKRKEDADDFDNDNAKKNVAKKFDSVNWWFNVWAKAFVIPVIAFVLVAYVLALHVCWAYWSTPDPQPDCCWGAYRFALAGLLIIDVISLLATVCSISFIKHSAKELEEHYTSGVGDKLEKS